MFDLDLDESMFDNGSDVSTGNDYAQLSEFSIVPKVGCFLGLDISQNSSGICFYKNGEKFLYNSTVTYDKTNPHAEALLRKQLKDDLLEVVGDSELDLVVVEDVYEGSNPEVVRKLYALNTAIDDLILDGKVVCKTFVRVSNVTWKSWLSVLDTENKYKGYKDKERIQGYLSLVGISDSGNGFQDRLDATGMLIGYFLRGKESVLNKVKSGAVRVSFSDIVYSYECDSELITLEASTDRDDEINVVIIDDSRLSKKKMVDYLSGNLSAIFITKNPIKLGLLADSLGIDYLEEGEGYFGFWLSSKAQRKYKGKLRDIG